MFWNKKNHSIIWRLTALYSSSILIILLIISFVLYHSLKHELRMETKARLLGHAKVIVGFLKHKPIDANAIYQEISVEPTMTESIADRFFTRVLSGTGKVLFSTPGMSQIITFDQTAPELSEVYFQNQQFLVLTKINKLNSNVYGAIQVAINTEEQKVLLQKYLRVILIVLIAGVILSVLLGYFMAKKSMQPLSKITHKLKQLTTEQLHQRLEENQFSEELAPLASAFNSMCDGLEISFNKLKQFSNDLAHELRTPINNLIGETELALNQERSVDRYQAILISNLEEAQRLSQIVSGLLFLAQTEASQIALNKKNINAKKIITSIMDYYSAVAEEKNISIGFMGSNNLEIYADEVLLNRVLNNILSNAIKYTPDNGKIIIEIGLDKKHNATIITITDTGIGIAEKDLPLVFNRFYRVNSARTQHGKSSVSLGLGLSIVKSIVDLHKAQISIQKNPQGIGTEVKVIFPVS